MSISTATPTAIPCKGIPIDQLGGATALYLDFLYHPEKVEQYFGPAFDQPGAIEAKAEEVSARPVERAAMVDVLNELAEDYQATPKARANIERLKDPDSLVVFTGQQVGLFSGPLYTIYKALCTERWADQLTEQLGRLVIPCFWLSTDDHDFAEVDHIFVPRGDEIVRVQYAPTVPPDGDPMGRLRIDRTIDSTLDAYASVLPDTEFKADIFALLRECYAPGNRYAAGFGRLWARMFPDSGLVPVSPCHVGFKRLAEPILSGALTNDRTLFEVYADASRRLEEDGYHRQVYKAPDQTLIFYQQFKRHNIHHDDQGGYVWEGGDPVRAEWIEKMVAERPDYFSPNVLLRPVVQNGLFPTIGVTLGPSETAYYAQIGGIHDHFGVPRPLILPRTTVTLMEKSVRKRMDKHDIYFEGLKKDADAEIARVMHASFPDDLESSFDHAEQQIADAFKTVAPDVVAFDPTLDKPLRAAQMRALREINQVAQKAYAAHKRKQEESEAQIRRVQLQLFPRGALQERSYNIVYYWARYGPQLLADLFQKLPAGQREHLIWEL